MDKEIAIKGFKALNDKNFNEIVFKAKLPMLVNFWSSWCEVCGAMLPFMEEIEDEYQNKMTISMLNVSLSPKTPKLYKINSVPFFMFVHKGTIKDKYFGASNSKLQKFVSSNMKTL